MSDAPALSRLHVLGAAGSPYTRKVIAALRYRHIPYALHWGSHRSPMPGFPEAKVKLLPTVYFPQADGGYEAQVDSTPILARLEQEYAGRGLVPSDPVIAFLDHLIEDFADEWLTKAMFHYRWAREADIAHAGPQLVFWHDTTTSNADAKAASDFISKRQIDRLYVVGSNAITAATIEQSYERLLGVLESLIQPSGFVMGARPGTSDFGIYGQLTQLGVVDPTPAALCAERTPRLRAWIDRMEDLSGLDPKDGDWLTRDQAQTRLAPLLAEIGRVYVPFLVANAQAAQAGQTSFETMIDGRAWTQPTFAYQAKCLVWLKDHAKSLSANDAAACREILADTGCEVLFETN
jgi:glutathione S-transferase